MDDLSQGDICRVCRCEALPDRPLFYPCICTGSIKYIHQDCLMQWMRYSHKEYCELCGHRFSFQPIYAPDMPRVLPLRDVLVGLMSAVFEGARCWLHYSLVGMAWFGVVPLSAYRTYRYLFRANSFDMILSLPFDIFSMDNLTVDSFRGCFVVTCTLLAFIGLVWLREQILHGGGPDWLERDEAPAAAAAAAAAAVPAPVPAAAPAAVVPEAAQDDNNNGDAPQDVPMDNEAPAVANPADNEGDAAQPAAAAAAAPAARIAAGAGAAADVDNDEQNWNPMEWDRAAEELTWERLLGLDGSLVFLEHVFWIISLNTMFIFTFAFCPYCVGNFILSSMDLLQPEKPLLHFHGMITTLFGYCCIGLTLVVLHFFARVFRMRRICWFIGLCYIVVKVSLLSVVEIGVLPLICGWWLDICSLPLLDASLKDRKASFKAAPGTSIFVHWMFGMVYVYYFAAFISLLREVLRPGVLWIFRNVNDPDFSPIQEMIHVPIVRHVRRLVASAMIFGFAVLLMLWLPIRILQVVWPNFLPYALSGDSEVNDLSLQLLLLQIVLPGFFEQTQTRTWLKSLLRIWCRAVAWLLGIRSYLLPAPEPPADAAEPAADPVAQPDGAAGAAVAAAPPAPPPAVPEPAAPRNLAAAHQAIMQRDVPVGFQPYERPTFFVLRLSALLTLMCFSIMCAAMLMLTVPVYIGRRLMMAWTGQPGDKAAPIVAGDVPLADPEAARKSERMLRPHELYTAEIGGYLCWIVSRGIAVVVTLLPQGRTAIVNKLKHWARVALQYALPVLTLLGIFVLVPLLFGLVLELVVVIPLRVPMLHTPIHFLWQDWALGVLYTKIAIAVTLMGPDWHLKRALERAYTDGLRDFDLKFVMNDLAVPVVTTLGLALAIPYVLSESIIPMFVADPNDRIIVYRLVYPLSAILVSSICFVLFQIKQLKKLYLSIKVDKYLVGQRLVNYEHRKKQQAAQEKARLEAEEARLAQAQGEDDANPPMDLAEQAALHARRRRQQLARPLLVDANEELL
ncbi:E3 ubiquitin-protein ligase MARCHF6 [Drosophila grimshawi]|uniref:E3 ubiquitin-protein ligase MARCHF6 n=1 Tax=Drosophila grimshawi TaxID=7222 RepID=B4J0H8_DROGR|nr:E3 ubiquitin-protein ligase MARCHF6 [Drosophila grimshawi]EDV96814.1 GH15006 [Drosophila grimshawi]